MEKNNLDSLKNELKSLEERKKEIETLLYGGNNDLSIFKQFYGKWLYFEGCEEGSEIINITEVKRDLYGDLGFSGIHIRLRGDNDINMGIEINSDKEYLMDFDNLPYFENAHDYEKLCSEGERLSESIPYVVEWLKDGTLGLNSKREITNREFEEIIKSHLHYVLNDAFRKADIDCEDEIIPFFNNLFDN